MVAVEEVMFVADSSEFVQVGSRILHLKEPLVSPQLGCVFLRRRRGFTP